MPPKRISRADRLVLIGLNNRVRELLTPATHTRLTNVIETMDAQQRARTRDNAWGSLRTILSGPMWSTPTTQAFHDNTRHLEKNYQALTIYLDFLCTHPELMLSFADGRMEMLNRIARIVAIDLLKAHEAPSY